jgi:hypothetical protein
VEILQISIDDMTGTAQFLVSESTVGMVDSFTQVQRASHVEPTSLGFRVLFRSLRALFGEYGRMAEFTRSWPCRWRVNLTPVGGPIVPVEWASRQSAIEFEIEWLNKKFI